MELHCALCHGRLERAGPQGAIMVCPSCKKGAWLYQLPNVDQEVRIASLRTACESYGWDRRSRADAAQLPLLSEGV